MKRFSLASQIFYAMCVGIVVGLIFKQHVAPLGEFGKIFIQLIKIFAGPLLFLVILESLVTVNFQMRQASRMVFVASFNAILAMVIAFSINETFKPGRFLTGLVASVSNKGLPAELQAFQNKKIELSFISFLQGLVPQSLLDPFLKNEILSLIFLALLFGFGLRQVSSKVSSSDFDLVVKAIQLLLRTVEQILQLLVKISPVAVLCVVAKAVGTQGLYVFKPLLIYLIVPTAGFLIQIIFVYQCWIKFKGGIKLSFFWNKAKTACAYAFGVNSSLATVPLTLKALDEMDVSPEAARLGACVGTNLNNDGILLYEVASVLLIAQAMGMSLTLLQKLAIAGTCIFATIGVAGVPDAGIISLSLILPQFGISTDLLVLFLSVDWALARFRSVTNVISDLTVSIAIDESKDTKTVQA